MDKALILAAVLALGGCALSLPVPLHIGLPCSAGPIILDKTDQLSRKTAEQIVALDEAGAKLCGWRPPRD